MRKLLLAVVLALVVASCGGTESESDQPAAPAGDVTAPSEDSTPTSAPATSGDDSSTDDTATEPDASTSIDGPPAPDFELALSDGSTFALSDEQKPVYVVFWAEW